MRSRSVGPGVTADTTPVPGVTVLRDRVPFGSLLPMALQVEFTSRCNLRCRMCPLTTGTSSSSGTPGPMSEVVFDEVRRMAKRCGRVVLAGYGEPLTNPQCLPMLRTLDGDGVEVHMATNGLAITPSVARQLVALKHLTHVNVSIDSPDPDVYRKIRGGNVHRALQGLRNLMAVVDEPRRVIVSAVAMQDTLPSLVGFPALLAGLGVRRFNLQAVLDYNDFAREQRLLDHDELFARLEDIEAECARHGLDLELSVPDRTRADLADPDGARQRFYGYGGWDDRLTRQCHVPWDIPFVDKDGKVFACCFAASADERQLGQLGPQTFEEIWTGPAFQRFRSDIVDGRTTPQICRRCSVAPLGEHLFKVWGASVVSGQVTEDVGGGGRVTVLVRNESARAWAPGDHVRVGTSSPRDAPSPLRHRSWLSPNRPATFTEAAVPPGGLATFKFPVATATGSLTTAEFEIVAEGACWLPDTRFAVTATGPRRSLLAPLVDGLRRRHGPVAVAARRALPVGARRWLIERA